VARSYQEKCIPPIVARQQLGKSLLIVARQHLGKNPLIVAKQQLGRKVNKATDIHATIEELLYASFFSNVALADYFFLELFNI
jgi:hypothetical protein